MISATLITGLPGAGKSRLIEAWRLAAQPHEAVAVLSNGSSVRLPYASDLGEARQRLPSASSGEARQAASRFGLGRPPRVSTAPSSHPPWLESLPGCLCCTARATLPAALARLHKRGPWDHLLIELNGAARPADFIDLLRSQALASSLRLVSVIAVLDAGLERPTSERATALLTEQVATADRIWLRAASSPSVGPALASATQAWQEWIPSIREFGDVPQSWCAELPPPWSPARECSDRSLIRRSDREWSWQSPATHVHDRAGLEAALGRALADGCFERMVAAFRTERDWYAWHGGAGVGVGRDTGTGAAAGAIARLGSSAEGGLAEIGRPTLFRSSNRIELTLAAHGPLGDGTGERLQRWLAELARDRISGS